MPCLAVNSCTPSCRNNFLPAKCCHMLRLVMGNPNPQNYVIEQKPQLDLARAQLVCRMCVPVDSAIAVATLQCA
eukprot:1711251-Amphidinium_carterae.1